jgi:molecular chaperone DnaK (HSP70)
MSHYRIGIDFGTTNTAVVCIQDDELGQRVRPLGEGGEYPFSSIVAIPQEGRELLFGRKVREREPS